MAGLRVDRLRSRGARTDARIPSPGSRGNHMRVHPGERSHPAGHSDSSACFLEGVVGPGQEGGKIIGSTVFGRASHIRALGRLSTVTIKAVKEAMTIDEGDSFIRSSSGGKA